MEIKDKQIALINELYRSFDFFNNHFCNNNLQRPLITLQGDNKRSTYGWFGGSFWNDSKDEKSKINELNLTAETLHREPTHVLGTLLHEMAHLKNFQEGIKDCNAAQYHNKAFKISAEYFGLVVEKMKNKGYAITKLSDSSLTAIELLKPKIEVYCIVRNPPKKPKKDSEYITLQVDLSFKDKIDFLMNKIGKKREVAEEAIDLLYAKYYTR